MTETAAFNPSRGRETRSCAFCGGPITRYRSQFRLNAPAFCGRSCQGAYKSIHGTGPKAANWRGGTRTSNGYIEVYAPWCHLAGAKGYVPLHILVFMLANGRPPLPGMVIHHADRDTTNNHPDNLVEMTQSEHVRLHVPRKGTGRHASI